jgi:hypothetical protein
MKFKIVLAVPIVFGSDQGEAIDRWAHAGRRDRRICAGADR